MKKKRSIFAMMLAAVMCLTLLAGCGSEPGSASGDTIKVGILGPHTGDTAVYGLAVKNAATLYFDEINANGGINGKQIELIVYDNKGNDAESINSFNRMVSEGMTALLGDVLTGNTIAVVGEAYPINMPMITASATAAAVTVGEDGTVYSNVFRTCFIDPFQGEKMAQYASEVLGATTAAILYENGDDYSTGLKESFENKCSELGVEIVAVEAFSNGDTNFKAQLTNIHSKSPDVVFVPAYYEVDGMIVTQARQIGSDAIYMGGDGWSDVVKYASAEDLEGSVFCSAYAPGSSDAVIAFEEAYIEKYGKDTLNMFAANAYDAAMILCNALSIAEESGAETGSDEYKQAVIDAMRDNSGDISGVTSDGYAFDQYNNPIKDAVIIKVTGGEPTFDRIF